MTGNSTTLHTGLEQLLQSLVLQVQELTKQVATMEAKLSQRDDDSSRTRNWLRLSEAAELLNVSPKTVRRYLDRKLLRKSAASRHILIPAEDVEKLREKVIV